MKYKLSHDDIAPIAFSNGYRLLDFQKNIGMISYTDEITRINVYLTTATVATCLKHPVKGKTQLFRKNVTLDMLREIFEYPRKHTGKGYYKK